KGFDVVLADLPDHRGNNVLQIVVVGLRPYTGRRTGRGNHQTILFLVVQEGEIMPLPVCVGPCAMKAKDESDLLARLQIARIVEEVSTAGLHLHRWPRVNHPVRRAVLVRAVEKRGRDAWHTAELDKLLAA